MENKWKTSVNELIAIFKGALIALVPWLEKAKINWKENEHYDDWDNIANVLFNNIICSSLFGEILEEYPIARYDFEYDNYSELNFILVKSEDYDGHNLAFVSFQSISLPLDHIKVAMLNDSDKVVEYLTLEADNIEFSFVRKRNDKKEISDTIEITP